MLLLTAHSDTPIALKVGPDSMCNFDNCFNNFVFKKVTVQHLLVELQRHPAVAAYAFLIVGCQG